MEGVHFGGGPWFAVLKTNKDNDNRWHYFGDTWWSNGTSAGKARVEIQMKLEKAKEK